MIVGYVWYGQKEGLGTWAGTGKRAICSVKVGRTIIKPKFPANSKFEWGHAHFLPWIHN